MTFQTPQKSKNRFFETPSAKQIASMSRQEKINLLNQLNNSNQFTASNFNSPGRGKLRSARPNTGMSYRSNASKASVKSSARKSKKPAPIRNLIDLVKKSDKMSHELVIDYLN